MANDLVADVLAAIASAKETEPDDVVVALEDHVSTDALRTLARHQSGVWALSFELPDHEVTVSSDGRITVDGSLEREWTDDRRR